MASPVRVEAITGLRRSPAHRQTGEDVVEPDGGRLRAAVRRAAGDGAGVAAGRTGQLEERFAVAGPCDLRTATARGVEARQPGTGRGEAEHPGAGRSVTFSRDCR